MIRRQAQRGATLVRILALAAYVCSTLGFPLPVHKGHPGEERFPCQDRPCGCQTARECWTSCQCYSPAERVVWARRHGQAIPAYAVLPAADELLRLLSAEWEELAEHQEGGCHCAAPTPEPSRAQQPQKSADRGTRRSIGWVLGILAAKCGGAAGIATAGVDFALPPLAVHCERDTTAALTRPGEPSLHRPLRAAPPSPPPES